MVPKQNGQGIYLRASRDIEHVKRQGRRSSTGLFNLLAAKMDESPTRVGIVVGRRFGDAVRRNRVKRRFRELTRALHPEFIPGHGIVVFPKREALQQSFAELKQLWEATLRRNGLLRPKSN
jgi:ribonuclease P protein component